MELEQLHYTPEEIEAIERVAVVWKDTVWGLDGCIDEAVDGACGYALLSENVRRFTCKCTYRKTVKYG
jgi:hypothetical protein